MKFSLAITALLALASVADAQVVVQQQRGLFRNSSTVAVGAGAGNVVVNQQRGLFRNSSTVAVGGGFGAGVVVNNSRRSSQVVVGGGGYGGATFAQRSFAPAYHSYHQRTFAAPAYYQYQQRQVALAPVASYSYAVQRAVYAVPEVQQQIIRQQVVYAAPPPAVHVPRAPRAPSCTYAPPQQLQQFAPQYAPGGCCGGGVGNGNGGQTYLPAAQAMLDRFGVPGY